MEVKVTKCVRYAGFPIELMAFHVAVVNTPDGMTQFEFISEQELRHAIMEATGQDPVFVK